MPGGQGLQAGPGGRVGIGVAHEGVGWVMGLSPDLQRAIVFCPASPSTVGEGLPGKLRACPRGARRRHKPHARRASGRRRQKQGRRGPPAGEGVPVPERTGTTTERSGNRPSPGRGHSSSREQRGCGVRPATACVRREGAPGCWWLGERPGLCGQGGRVHLPCCQLCPGPRPSRRMTPNYFLEIRPERKSSLPAENEHDPRCPQAGGPGPRGAIGPFELKFHKPLSKRV